MIAKIIFLISGIICIITFFLCYNPFLLSTGIFLVVLGVRSRAGTPGTGRRRKLYELRLRLKGMGNTEIEKRMRIRKYFLPD